MIGGDEVQQLLRITSQPLRYELSTQRASLQLSQQRPSSVMTKQGGEMQIQQRQVQMQLDTLEYRSSVGLKSIPALTREAVQRGEQAAMQATAEYADFGNQILRIDKGATIPDAMFSKIMQRAQSNLVLVPISPMEISWLPGGTELNYTPVNLNFDWDVGKLKLDFVPGSISMNITQYPSVQIEYLGQPNYVPPSAAAHFTATA